MDHEKGYLVGSAGLIKAVLEFASKHPDAMAQHKATFLQTFNDKVNSHDLPHQRRSQTPSDFMIDSGLGQGGFQRHVHGLKQNFLHHAIHLELYRVGLGVIKRPISC